jgi:hypothetical protein
MRVPVFLLAATALAAAAGSAQAASVEVRDAVARVTVIPEARNDIKVEFLTTNPRLPIAVRTQGDKTIVDGGLHHRVRGCRGAFGRARVAVRGVGDVDWRDIPQVVIRTPRDVKIASGEAVFGSVGRSASLDLANGGCGDWTVANVEGAMRINQAGSGDTRAGAAGQARIRTAGSGDVAVTEIRGGLEVDIAGSGDVTAGSISGPFEVRVAGAGDVKVGGGHASAMTVAIAGSGDVNFGGVADTLRARIMGSGDIHVRHVKAPVSKVVMGSGTVDVGD